MRPRAFYPFTLFLLIYLPQAYGNYNNLVRQASYVRGQKLVTWDFEYVFPLISKERTFNECCAALKIPLARRLLRASNCTTMSLLLTLALFWPSTMKSMVRSLPLCFHSPLTVLFVCRDDRVSFFCFVHALVFFSDSDLQPTTSDIKSFLMPYKGRNRQDINLSPSPNAWVCLHIRMSEHLVFLMYVFHFES
jgi:hypothetical protein